MTSEPRHAPRAKRAPFVLLIVGLMAGGMCLLLALNTASAANEVARHDLSTNDQSAAAQLVELENEVQASAAPANVAAAAAALGMVPAGNPAFLEIDKSGKVRVMGSAAPASVEPVVIPHPAPTATKTKPAPQKSAKKTANKTAKATSTKSPGKTPSTTTGKTTTSTGSRAHAGAPAAATSSTAPSPTPTPTPETTLPGGNR
ncbi:MAG TPA: hypothetical protein VIG48_09000 [Jatrophihabitans sp.]